MALLGLEPHRLAINKIGHQSIFPSVTSRSNPRCLASFLQFVFLRPAEPIRRELRSIQLPQPAMSFLEKKKKMRHGPEPAEELFVRVHVGEGYPQYDSVFALPASHLTRPRLAPLVAMAEDTHQGGDGYVIRIECQISDFAQAMALTAVEEAAEGRTAWGRVVVPAGSRRLQTREASILEQARTRGRKTSKAKSTKSLAARISERLRDYMATKHKPSPQTTPPPPCDTSFRPTWARNRRTTSVPRSQL